MRFDVPVIGIATIQVMRRAGASALSIDAGRTLIMDGDHVLSSANEAGITIVGREKAQQPAGRHSGGVRQVETPSGR
jgi:DUF1009 family protein